MIKENLNNTIYKTAIYIRLSQEDRNKKINTDSESVNNQKTLLTKYCKDNTLEIYNYYIDDGFTGTNFNRPAFNQLIEDIELNKINTVLIKDFSRLGREHIETGHYMERYFPEKNIRLISIQDGYDSLNKNIGFDSSPLMITLHDLYSRQNSTKIKSVLDTKKKQGKFIGSKPSYGYMRDPEDKGHLIPDPNVAKNVKLIFNLRFNNVGLSAIATKLNNEGIPTPSYYKKLPQSTRLKNNNIWTISSVKKILENEMYIGNMVQNKQAKASFKSKKKKTLTKSEWIIIPNTHEALVDIEVFNNVNQKKINKERIRAPKTNRPIRILEGLLYCLECGNKLGITCKKKNNYWSINCNKYARDPIRAICSSHFFPYEKLEKQILKELDTLLSKLFSYVNINELNKSVINNNSLNSNTLEQKKIKYLNDIEKVNNTIQIAYQDRVDGNITIEEYKLIISPFSDKLTFLNKEIELIDLEITKNNQNSNKIPDYTNSIKKLLNSNNPNRDLIQTLIDKITIDKQRNITIKFKYNLLEEYSFKYIDNSPIRNPYGRKGKKNMA